MALQNGRKQTGLEAREQRDVSALAGDVVKMLRRVVDLFQEARGVQRRLGKNDDVDILQPREAADQVAALGLFKFQKRNLGIKAGASGHSGHALAASFVSSISVVAPSSSSRSLDPSSLMSCI